MTEILETARLRLVPHAAEHLRALISGTDSYRSASGLTSASGLRDFLISKDVSPDWLAALETASGCDPWTYGFALLHRESDTVIGNASFVGPPDADGMVEIAYGVVPDYQGKGFATEAANALVAFARRSGRVKAIRAHTLPQRNSSASVLEKSGFHRVADVIDPVDGPIWRWELSLGQAST